MKQKEIPEWAPADLVNYYNELKDSSDDYDINGLSKSSVAERLIFDDRMEEIWPKLWKWQRKKGVSEDKGGGVSV